MVSLLNRPLRPNALLHQRDTLYLSENLSTQCARNEHRLRKDHFFSLCVLAVILHLFLLQFHVFVDNFCLHLVFFSLLMVI